MRAMCAAAGLSSVAEAIEAIGRRATPLEVVTLPLSEAGGLTLAQPVTTDLDAPPFDKSMMDGFAVRSSDCRGAGTRLRIAGEVAAGESPDALRVEAGQAIRINTGAPIPPGADAVVMIERVELSADGAEMTTAEVLKPGAHIAPRACDARAGQCVLEAGVRLAAAQIAAAAAAGAARVRVYRRPRVAILVTGDELVDVSERPSGGQIRNSNGPALMALARRAGAEVVDLGVARDDPVELRRRIDEGLGADLFCLSGGVSMGQHDYVPRVLAEAGVAIEVQKIAVKPGKPSLFGVGPAGQWVFGLPGNPTSAYVCFVLFVRAALAAMQGRAATMPPMIEATLVDAIKPAGARTEFIPAILEHQGGASWSVRTTRWTGSGDVFGLGRCNAFVHRPANAAACGAGERVEVMAADWAWW